MKEIFSFFKRARRQGFAVSPKIRNPQGNGYILCQRVSPLLMSMSLRPNEARLQERAGAGRELLWEGAS